MCPQSHTLSSSCIWCVFRHYHFDHPHHACAHTLLALPQGSATQLGSSSDVKPREIWDALRGKSTNKYVFSSTLIVTSSVKHKQACASAYEDTEMQKSISRPLSKHCCLVSYEKDVSHMNISCWASTGWMKPWCFQTYSLLMSDHVCKPFFSNFLLKRQNATAICPGVLANIPSFCCSYGVIQFLAQSKSYAASSWIAFTGGWECIFWGPLCWNYVQLESKSTVEAQERVWGESSCIRSWMNKRAFKSLVLMPNTDMEKILIMTYLGIH